VRRSAVEKPMDPIEVYNVQIVIDGNRQKGYDASLVMAGRKIRINMPGSRSHTAEQVAALLAESISHHCWPRI